MKNVMKSAPPRGSGWVIHCQLPIANFRLPLPLDKTANRHLAIGNRQSQGPTRYREVVLTLRTGVFLRRLELSYLARLSQHLVYFTQMSFFFRNHLTRILFE